MPEYLSVLDPVALPAQSAGASSPDAVPVPQTGVVDPLTPLQREDVPEVQQPDANVLPRFVSSLGWFGSGFARPSGTSVPQRVGVTVGADRVYVLSTLQKRVYVYDTKSLATAGPGSFATGMSGVDGIAYRDGPTGPEVYVLGRVSGGGAVNVFRPDGSLKRTVRPAGGEATTWSGIDAAWGELWLTRVAKGTNGSADDPDLLGQEIAIFDAQTGALKARSQQPVGDLSPSIAPRSWWDLSIVPEYAAAFVDRRAFSRLPVVPSVPLPDSLACTGGTSSACGSADQHGTDAVWGMRWLLELVSYASTGGHRPVEEFSIEHRKIATSLLDVPITVELPGLYLVPKRTWTTQQQMQGIGNTVSDLHYNNREVRIDWTGPLTTTEWLRGDKCLTYVVSKADIFVVGDKGERWFELADDFEYIDFFLDGVRLERRFTVDPANPASIGDFCLDTRLHENWPDLLNGAHTIELVARVAGKDISILNDQLKIDNLDPTGTVHGLAEFSRGSTTVAVTANDEHSKVADWQIQAAPAGGGWQTICSGRSSNGEPGVQSCQWDTTRQADGAYTLRGLIRDRSSDEQRFTPTATTDDDGNSGETGRVGTVVDNTPPVVDNPTPDLSQVAEEYNDDLIDEIAWSQSDATSGVQTTTVAINSATDGSASGSWKTISESGVAGDVERTWDTTGEPPGLRRFRAEARDRAGNVRIAEWQAVMPERRQDRDGPTVDVSTCRTPTPGDRCFVDFLFGRGKYHHSWGVEGTMRVPNVKVGLTRGEFSAAFVNVGTPPRWLQGGYDSSGCDANQREGWYLAYEFIGRRGKQYLDCPTPSRPEPSGETNAISVRVYRDPNRYSARVYENGALVHVADAPGRGTYWLTKRGREDSETFLESSRAGRRAIGIWAGVRHALSGPDAFVPVGYGPILVDRPYQAIVSGSVPGNFCASGPSPGSNFTPTLDCTPP